MRKEIIVKSKSGKNVKYAVVAEKGEFNVYTVFGNEYKVISYPKTVNGEKFFVVKDKGLNKELGAKENQEICLPHFDKKEIINEMKKEIKESNIEIKVSYLNGQREYVVEYDLDFNLSKSEVEKYKTGENDGAVYFSIPAQELYIDRNANNKSEKDEMIECPACEHSFSKHESVLFHNGACPKCGF